MPHSFVSPRVAACFAAFALVAVSLLAGAGSAHGAALAELRVEGPDGNIDPGTWYVTGGEKIKRAAKPTCQNRKGKQKFPGSTALGILGSADDVNENLRPTRFRPTSFGPQMCGLGDLKSFGAFPAQSGGWLYHVNYTSGFSSADLATIENGDRVLWVYSVFPPDPGPPTGQEVNTGRTLELIQVPAGDQDGSFQVKVIAHDFDGTPSDVNDATFTGGSVTPVGSGGLYDVSVNQGFSTLRATRGLDVPSNPVKVCVDPVAADCPSAHGRRIVGSDAGDSLSGTNGWDVISTGAGDDDISLLNGGRDVVHCGAGRDVVTITDGDRDDTFFPECERVVRIA